MSVIEPLGRGRWQTAGQTLGVAASTRVDGECVRELKERQCYESEGESAVEGAHGSRESSVGRKTSSLGARAHRAHRPL